MAVTAYRRLLDEQQPIRVEARMHELPVLVLPARDDLDGKALRPYRSEHVDAYGLHGGAYFLGVPALPLHTHVHDAFSLLGHALLTEVARVCAERQRLIVPRIKG